MKQTSKSKAVFNCFCQVFVYILVLCWLLSVVKVFLIDSRDEALEILPVSESLHVKSNIDVHHTAPKSDKGVSIQTFEYYVDSSKETVLDGISSMTSHAANLVPRFSEWGIAQQRGINSYEVDQVAPVHSSLKPKLQPLVESNSQPRPAPVQQRPPQPKSNTQPKIVVAVPNKNAVQPDNSNKIPPHELKWPPVRKDMVSMEESDGYDIMFMTNLEVPRFWEPPSNDEETMMNIGSYINGEPTIFLMIASYRDFQCRETITSAYLRSDHPERLFVGAVDQLVAGDIGCLDIDIPCSEDPTQMICKYKDQISVFKMDASFATGPVSARHVGDRMYRGQYFVMQMDAHCMFINSWDTKIISQWKSTGNEMAVLSSYLTDVQGSIDEKGNSRRSTRPIMCNSSFEGVAPARYLRHGSQPEDYAAIKDMPQLQPFWAAGFSFSRGHFKVQVPYDAYQPMVFQGEEIAIGIRGFTYGYDFYAPRDSVVFHEYAERSKRRKKIHMFWENSDSHKGEAQKSLRRSMAIIGMALDIDPTTWDHSETSKYGLGSVRDASLFYKTFLINPATRKAVQLCPFVNSGIMHKAFQPHLRPNGRGIDYSDSSLQHYDTISVLNQKLKTMGRPPAKDVFASGVR